MTRPAYTSTTNHVSEFGNIRVTITEKDAEFFGMSIQPLTGGFVTLTPEDTDTLVDFITHIKKGCD